MSLVIPEKFQHILRIMNTNIDGKRKVGIAMTAIKGVGRRYSNIVLKKADVDLTKRAGECTEEEVDKVVTIISNPLQYKVPNWFLNRQKDIIDGKYSQLTSSNLDSKLRDDLERLKKIRSHRGLRHYWGLRVRGQHTKTTGRRGRTVGVSKKNTLALVFFLIFMCPSLVICMMIVTEKKRYLRDMLQIMGVSSGLNWLSWFIVAFVMFMIPTTAIVIMMKVLLCDHSAIPVLMFIFIIYVLFLLCRTFLVCAIFCNPFMAMIVLCILNIVSSMPFYMLFGSDAHFPIIFSFMCFCVNSSMPYILIQVAIYEIRGLGVQWGNMFRCGFPEDRISYGEALVTMIFGSILCIALCLYLDQLRPGGFRAPRKWYFPFTRAFYCPQRNPNDTSNEDEQVRNTNIMPFEEVTHDKAVIIDSRNLSKAFGPKQAVKNFSLKIYENEITVLLGHNGAGKTTILMLMAGLYAPTSGRVLINGHDTAVSPQGARKNLCVCPQNHIFFEELSAFWHINFYCRLKGLSRWNAEQEAHTYLYKINLKHMANMKVRNLSIDMRRKLSLCCALCAGTKVVLCDDPSSNLDPSACRDIWDLLRTEKEGRCILLSTYSVNDASMLADRIAIISDGELIGYGTSDFLLNSLGPGYRLACVPLPDCRVGDITMFLRAKMREIRLESVEGSEIVYRLPVTKLSEYSTLFRALERRLKKLRLASFGVSAPTMDETFSKIAADKINQSYFFNFIAMNEWMQQGKNIQETSKCRRFLSQWHGLFMKKWLYTRDNLIPLTWLIILPFLITGFNILTRVMESKNPNPYLTFDSLLNYSNAIILRENEFEETDTMTEYRPKEISAEYDRIAMLQGGTLRGIRNKVDDYLLSHLNLNEEGYETTFVAGATFSTLGATAWFNRRLTHGQPTSISLLYKAIGNCLADVDISFINYPRPDSHVTPYHADTGGNAEKHATRPFIMLSWLFVCLMAYAFTALSLIYLISFTFDGPYNGMACLIFCNTVTVFVAINTHLHRDHEAFKFIHSIFLIEPYYAMYSAMMATILEGNRIAECEALNQTECPGRCCIKKKIYTVAKKELQFMLISGTIYFSLTLLWTKFCPRAIKKDRDDCRIASENDDAKEAGRQVDNIVKNEDKLKSYSLVCHRVKKTFTGLEAVNCVSIKISPYECLGILGIRGAGKTCLIDLIVGNRKVFQGNIYVKGFSMKDRNQRQKCFSHMGYCPQHHMVWHYMTGREMLKLACLIRGIKKQYISRITESLAEGFVFGKYLDQMTVHYSNSTKRKLNIAIAVLSPTLICLDDPITDVDICAKQEISKVLRQMLSYGKSLLITSHSVYDCEILCTSLAIMVKVKIQVGTAEEMDEIKMSLVDLSSGPSGRTSEIKNTDDKEQQEQEQQSPNEKAVQVHIKKKRKSSKIESLSSAASSKSSKQEEIQSIGKGILVRKKRKTSVSARRTTTGVSRTGSSLLNVYITNNDESNFFSLLMDVEKRFKIDYPRSYVTDTFSYRGLVTIIIPDKDLKWSEIFKYLEDNRFQLQIKHYAISQTTLEDIFLNVIQE
ncbi:hypothetical protein ACLKA7_013922 [Drosophila subpalustris]